MIDWHQELDRFTKIHSESSETFELGLTTQETWKCFRGHFPNQPILPGVAMIDISQWVVEKIFFEGRSMVLKSVQQLRIKNPIGAGHTLLLRGQRDGPDTFRVVWLDEAEVGKTYCEIVFSLGGGAAEASSVTKS